MKSATIFDERGAIVEAMSGSEADIETFTVNRPHIDGFFKASEYYVSGGQAIKFPSRPNDFYVWDYAQQAWVVSDSLAIAKAMEKRARLLQLSDWTDTASAPTRLGATLYEAWQAYRQALRDITQQSGYPENINWPTAPTAAS